MKHIKFWGIMLLSVTFFLYAPYCHAATGSSKETLEESQKTVRIVIEQSYRDKNNTVVEGVRLPAFETIARKLLPYANLKILPVNAENYDLTLKIQASGRGSGNEYSIGGFGKGTFYYTGASLTGEIALELSGVPIHRTSFSGNISPPSQINIYEFSSSLTTALFTDIVWQPNSFGPAIIKLIGEIYGPRFLITAMKDNDSDVRQYAERILLYNLGKSAVESLITLLTAEDSFVRLNAVKALGQINDPQAVTPLVALLNDENTDVREQAMKAIEKFGTSAVEPLLSSLQSEDSVTRKNVVVILGQIKDPQAVEPLIVALKDTDADVRSRAVKALGQIKDPQAVDPLIIALKDTDANVRRSVVEALGQIKDPRSVEPLIILLKDEDADVRKEVVATLENIGEKAVEPLIVALKDGDVEVRTSAVNALGQLKNPQAVESLIRVLKDEDAKVRETAVKALKEIGEAAMGHLIETLQNQDFSLRVVAAWALGQIGDARATAPLIVALQDREFFVQAKAAEALGEIQDSQAIEPLIKTMKTGNVLVKKQAGEALKKITKQSFGEDYDAWLKWWEESSQTLSLQPSPMPVQSQREHEQQLQERQGVIRIPSGSPIYSKPDGGTIVARVQTDIDLKILEQRGQWYKVTVPGGITGWISEDQLPNTDTIPTPSKSNISGCSTKYSIRLYKSPSEKYASIDVPRGEQITIITTQDEWYNIETSHYGSGWIRKSQITLEGCQ